MTADRRALQQEVEQWKRSLPIAARGRKAVAARQLRDSLRLFTFGFRDWLEDRMRPQGMTVAQLRMLFAVRFESEASSARIARLCQVTPQTMQAMLERAVREQWLVRRPAVHNARVLVSSLTAKGNALLQQAMDATEAFELQVWRSATTEQLQAMNAAFQEALKRMDQATAGTAGGPATGHAGTGRRKSKPKSAGTR